MTTLDQVKSTVADFARGGDTNDVSLLDNVLHPDFKNVQDGFFEEQGVFVFSKDDYKKLVETKRFGGSARSIEFKSVEILGNIARVNVHLESAHLVFNTFLLLVHVRERWKVLYNIPSITRK